MVTIICIDCGEPVEAKTRARKLCVPCGNAREAQRRKNWWARNPTYAADRYWADPERYRAETRRRYEEDREAHRERSRRSYQAHRESALEYARAYRETHKAEIAEYRQHWYEANAEHARAYAREWAAANPERRRENFRAWRKANPEAKRAHDHKRRARKAGALGEFTAEEFKALCEAFAHRCAYCDQPCDALTADHVVPLSKGGTNYIDNIVPACKSCNSRKHDKTPAEFVWMLGRVA